jgi:hypothetical protein
MKISTIASITGVLSGMKINKISDKRVKSALLNDYLHLRRHLKDADADREEVVKKFREDWRDELAAVEAFRKEGKAVVGHDAYLDAERDANQTIADIFNSDVEVSLASVSLDAFIVSFGKEELTFEQIALLQEGGIIE